MLVTILEIIVFMVAATVLGFLLGWLLRGMYGSEQAEITEVRAQLRKFKRAQREQEAAAKEQQTTTVAVVSDASPPTKNVETQVAADKKVDKKEETGSIVDAQATAVKTQPKMPKAEKPQVNKKSVVKKAAAKTAKKSTGARKSIAEREAEQTAASLAFSEVRDRIGTSDRQDNLSKIYGVGKRYAEMLNELGLSSFAQIGKLRKAEIKTLAAALGILDERVETEDWVGSAKTLAKKA